MNVNFDTIRLFQVFDQVADAIMVFDQSHRLMYFNETAKDLFELNDSVEEVSLPRLLTPSDPYIQCDEIFSVADLKGNWRGEVTHIRRDGTILHTGCSMNAICDERNETVGYLSIAVDISQFRAPSESAAPGNPYSLLEEFHKMEAIGRLAGILAHDFNNHLAGILGNLSVAVRKMDDAHPVHHLLMAARRSAERSEMLVQQLMSFAKRRGKDFESLDINQTLEGLRQTSPPANDGEFSCTNLIIQPAPSLPSIHGDASQIAQVVANLVINAQEALKETGTVRIRTETVQIAPASCSIPEGSYVLLEVADDGPGMDPQTKEHMFEPFFSTKTTSKISGAGLGLSVVWGIVHQHQGHIEVESEQGKGTLFRLYFPVETAQGSTAGAPQNQPCPQEDPPVEHHP